MTSAARSRRLRDLVEDLGQARAALDRIDAAAFASAITPAVTPSEIEFVRGAIDAAAAFVLELTEREGEARTSEGAG